MSGVILVTGGAGYVGVHSVLDFKSRGWAVTVLDDLSTGHADFARHADRFVEGSLLDRDTVRAVVRSATFDGILHCAALSRVEESVQDPVRYYRENVGGAANLVEAVAEHGSIPIVFSSSAAVYGDVGGDAIREDQPCEATSPYGRTKRIIEELLRDSDTAYGVRSVSLRYFNACGADGEARAGERHVPESHLIPRIINAALTSSQTRFAIFGRDYPTRDGTCVRDYIHVDDIARGHALAFEYLWKGGETTAINIGSGVGYTVLEIFERSRELLGGNVPFDFGPRRPGDPASLLADIGKAERVLGWRPEASSVDHVLRTAIAWHRRDLARQEG